MKDKCGSEIEQGCVVDVFINDVVAAYVLEVKSGGILGPNGPEPATLLLQIAIPMRLSPGAPAPVYVIRKSDKPAKDEGLVM